MSYEPVRKYITGFCGTGAHEGTKPKSPSGKPMKVCGWWEVCQCDCHDMLTRMFQEADMPRQLVDNPEYIPIVLPDLSVYRTIREVREEGAVLQESPDPETVPATLLKEFKPTPTGRAARGELETWVKAVCDAWLVEKETAPCTPQFISDTISREQGIKPPSVGAIGAVFDRWSDLGFANVARKPVRFLAYTEDGIKLGLHAMKQQAKLNGRKFQAEKNRTGAR